MRSSLGSNVGQTPPDNYARMTLEYFSPTDFAEDCHPSRIPGVDYSYTERIGQQRMLMEVEAQSLIISLLREHHDDTVRLRPPSHVRREILDSMLRKDSNHDSMSWH